MCGILSRVRLIQGVPVIKTHHMHKTLHIYSSSFTKYIWSCLLQNVSPSIVLERARTGLI